MVHKTFHDYYNSVRQTKDLLPIQVHMKAPCKKGRGGADRGVSRSNYLEPWCKNPKQSWAWEENLKYIPVLDPLCSKSTIFSTNLDAANRIPTPWSRKIGEKTMGSGIFLALAGVPWVQNKSRSNEIPEIVTMNRTQKHNIPLDAYKGGFENQL